MYLCILDREGKTVLHKNLRSRPQDVLAAVAPYRDDLVVVSSGSRQCGHPADDGCRSGTGQKAPSEKPCAGTSNPRLKRARKFSQAIAAVSSTSCSSLRSLRRMATSSSLASAGVRVRATA
jgi:hypothetical protein